MKYVATCIEDHRRTFRVFGKIRTWFFYNVTHRHPNWETENYPLK